MDIKTKQIFYAIFVCFICVTVMTGYLMSSVSDQSTQISILNENINCEKESHNQTKATLTTTNYLLNQTRLNLTTAQQQSSQLTTQLTTITTQWVATFNNWNNTKRDLNEATQNITILRAEVNASRSGTKYLIHDPTYNETISFLASDNTSNHTYNTTLYNCMNFSLETKTNATEKGIRCAIVLLYNATIGHAINLFNSTDQGLLYIEPQNDNFVNLTNVTVGGNYSFVAGNYTLSNITKIYTIW